MLPRPHARVVTICGRDGTPPPGVIQVALQRARLAAENILRTLKGQDREFIGFGNRVSVMTRWAFAHLTQQRPVRLITGDDA